MQQLMLYETLLAFLLFANPFGRFIVIATRAAGIELLNSIGAQEPGVFSLFLIASTVSSLACLALFNRFVKYAQQFKVAKKVVSILGGFAERVSRAGGSPALMLIVGIINFGTCPLYAAAACALAKVRFREAAIGLVLGNAASFTALYYFGLAFGKDLAALAGAAAIMTLLSLAVFYWLAKK